MSYELRPNSELFLLERSDSSTYDPLPITLNPHPVTRNP